VTYDPDMLRQMLLGASEDADEPKEEKPADPEHAEDEAAERTDTRPAEEKPEASTPPEPFPEESIDTPAAESPEVAPVPDEPTPSPEESIDTPPADSPEAPPVAREPQPVSEYEEIPTRPRVSDKDMLLGRAKDIIARQRGEKTGRERPVDSFSKHHGHKGRADRDEVPDDLERVTADNFAPLREVLKSREGKADHDSRDGEDGEGKRSGGRAGKEAAGRKPKRAREGKPPRKVVVHPPGPLSLLILLGGGISIAGAIIALAMGQTGNPPTALGGIGIGLVVMFTAINRHWLRVFVSSRSARYTANVATVIASLLGILIFVNLLAYRHHYRLDLSYEGLHSLSQHSLAVIDDINRAKETITVIAFASPDGGYRQKIEEEIDLYRYHTRYIDFRFVDPDVQRQLAEDKGITRNPSVLFELGENRSVVVDADEQHFTSALIAVRETRSRVVSFLAGHGEPDPFSDDSDQSGLSKLKKQLELEGYDVGVLRIPEANGVPAETSVLMIVSPQRALAVQEIQAIATYLDNGGRVMCFLEPGRDAGLGALMARYGIAPAEGLVLDDQRNAYGEIMSPIVLGNPNHPITSSVQLSQEGIVFLTAGSLTYTEADRLLGVELDSLMRSSASSWVETTDIQAFDEGVDERESVELAILATRPLETPGAESTAGGSSTGDSGASEGNEEPGDAETETPVKMAELLVVGDASFIQNASYDQGYNKDFALNAVDFLTSRHDLISIRPTTSAKRTMDLSPVQRATVFAVSVILTPLLIAGIGGLVWWRRR